MNSYPGKCDFTSYGQCQATVSGTYSYGGLNPVLHIDCSRGAKFIIRAGKKARSALTAAKKTAAGFRYENRPAFREEALQRKTRLESRVIANIYSGE
jgi:uncharacterized protein DUF3551